MKKLLSFILCFMILTGCTEPPTETTHSTSTQEIRVTESIINQTDTPSAPVTEETSQTATEYTETTWPFRAEPTPETKPAETIRFIVYTPNYSADGFYINAVEGNIVDGSEYCLTLHEAMVEMCLLTKDVQINSIIQDETHLTIDFNHAFKDLVCTMGTSGERLLVGSVVNTMIANYNVKTVSITVAGDVWESGHVIYDFPMGFFE